MKRSQSVPRRVVNAALLFALGACCPSSSPASTDTIPLKDLPRDSRLAIWGDSITEVTLSSRYIEMYLLACAGRKDIKVCTFGHSGERLDGLLSRQSDLNAFRPTIVTIHYGMNDTQYSVYTDEKGAAFDRTMRSTLAMLAGRGISRRVVVGPGLVDDSYCREDPASFFRGTDPGGLTAAQAQNSTLGHFRDIGRAVAVETSSAYADIHNRMKDSYTAAKKVYGPKYGFAAGGGVHPSPNGHLMIAHEILKALACDGDIGTIEVDMKGNARASTGHSVVGFSRGTVVLDSSRYPFCSNYDTFARDDPERAASILPFLPFNRELSRLVLKVTNLGAPSANVTWGGKTRMFTGDQLSAGVNLSEQFDETPFDATFARVMGAVADKQQFEDYMIKLTSNYNGNDNGGNIDNNMIAVHERKDAGVKAMLVPVRHAIAIEPTGGDPSGAPVIVGTMMAYATAGQAFHYRISALHSPKRFAAGMMPEGLRINPETGEIDGTPAGVGVNSITLTATNGDGEGSATLLLAVTPPLPSRPDLTSPSTATGTVGVFFTYQIAATNAPSHFFATSPGTMGTVPPASSLPSGLTYDTTTGILSGIPKTPGTYPIQVAAMNEAGVAIKLMTLSVKDR